MIHSFLFIGQSNMAGRGAISEAIPVDASNIRVLRNGRWQPMQRPINFDRAESGVCLAESFAEAYAKKHGVTVGLIPCADGGTSLDQWKEGGLLYDHAICQARLAQRTSTIAGVLWHQGESDCAPENYSTYHPRFETMMNAMRRDLDLYDVPFILGGIGDFVKDFTWRPEISENFCRVNEALISIAKNNDMVGFASAEGLLGNDDNLHFCSESLYRFGLRYFEQFEKLRDQDKIYVEKSLADAAIRSELEKL